MSFLSAKFPLYFGYWWSSIRYWGRIIDWKEFRSFYEIIAKISVFADFSRNFPIFLSVGFGQSVAPLPSKLNFHCSMGVRIRSNWDRWRRRGGDTRSLAWLGGGSRRRGCWGRLQSDCCSPPEKRRSDDTPSTILHHLQNPTNKNNPQDSIFPSPPQPHQNPISQTLYSSQPRHQSAPTTPKPPKSQTLRLSHPNSLWFKQTTG